LRTRVIRQQIHVHVTGHIRFDGVQELQKLAAAVVP
jgi:hypothetical protein